MRTKTVDGAVVQVPGHYPTADALVVHNEVEGEIFDQELGTSAQRLLVERVQNGMASAVGGSTGALGDAPAEIGGHTTESALVDLAFGRAREGHAVMLQLVDRGRRLTAHILYGVLVTEPVRALHRVVHVPAPVVVAHIAERRRDTALGRHGVAARGENFRQAGRLEAFLGHAEGSTQAGATGAHDDDIVSMIDDRIRIGHSSSALESDLEHGEDGDSTEQDAAKAGRQQHGMFGAGAVHIVLNHHLEPELEVVEGGKQHQHQQHRNHGPRQPGSDRSMIGSGQLCDRSGKPEQQRYQGDRRHTLQPPVLHAFLGSTEPAGGRQPAHDPPREA